MEHSNFIKQGRHLVRNRVVLSWLIGFTALTLAGSLPAAIKEISGFTPLFLSLLKAIAMSFLVLAGLLSIQQITGNKSIFIGIKTPRVAFLQFIAGFGIIMLPLLLVISFTEIFNWGEVRLNVGDGLFKSVFIGFLITFLFEAFPEEILFRGYIYSHLNIKYSKWVSGLMTVGLFALLPVTLTLFHKYALGMDIYLGGNYGIISLGYLIGILFFGITVQYLRILSGGVWLGMGFHLAFVHINHLIGPTEDKLIQLANMTSDRPIQIVFAVSILLIVLFLLFYPKITGRPLNWNGRNR